MILDDGGDATLYILLGAKAEKDPALIAQPGSEEEECLYAEIKKRIKAQPGLVRQGQGRDQGRVRRNHHRRAPPL